MHTGPGDYNIDLLKINDNAILGDYFKDAVQVRLHFTYNVQRYATVWSVLSKHDSSSQRGNTLRICTIISEIN